MSEKRLLIIEGPTASGKTALSVELAKKLKTIIISADSRQFYKEMSIGTAKPTLEERQGIEHFFIDSHSIFDPLTAAEYAKQVEKLLADKFQHHETIIMVGGSGMFIDAVVKGLDDIPASEELRVQLTEQWQNEGLDSLLIELKVSDPEYYAEVDKQNPMRVIRAVEAIRLSGKKYSSMRQGTNKENYFKVSRFVIDHPRENLYARINLRVDLMINEGLIEEARSLYQFRGLTALNTVGYSELFDYFENRIDLETAIALIKQNSRRYAKRQITWFKRNEEAVWIPFSTTDELLETILRHV